MTAENLAAAYLAEDGVVQAVDRKANVMVTPPHPTAMPTQKPVNATARPSEFRAFSEPSVMSTTTDLTAERWKPGEGTRAGSVASVSFRLTHYLIAGVN